MNATDVQLDFRQSGSGEAGARRDLRTLYRFTTALHKATTVEGVQEEVLAAVTGGLGFRRAFVGVVDMREEALTGWLSISREGARKGEGPLPHPARIPLSPAGGPVAEAVVEGRGRRVTATARGAHRALSKQFGAEGYLIVPLLWGIQPAGALVVEDSESLDDEQANGVRVHSLEIVTKQAALMLGMMRGRGRRARESAIKEERARIAREMHDTVSQSLFGLVYTLDGCLKLLGRDPAVVRAELEGALHAAEEVRRALRQAIGGMWPDEEMTAQSFASGLLRYTMDVLQAPHLDVRFDVRGEFGALSYRAQRSLYRISQEALTNAVHHAAAEEVEICVDVADNRGRLVVRDDGRGFEPQVALSKAYGHEHFGLRGMLDRAHSLGGTCDIFSRPGAGTSIVVDIPAHWGAYD